MIFLEIYDIIKLKGVDIMKRSISYIIISIIIFAAFGGCTACGNTTDNERITYSVVFNAEQGGRIE